MNQYVTGAVIKELREKNNLTQAELADRLCSCLDNFRYIKFKGIHHDK